ncbi:MAG: hypothetical protein K0S20_9 [Patescibacteria group bacterium]|jgi:mutator protein MutT|nr:hypothetical protein [Patescibacteria group bacterium]
MSLTVHLALITYAHFMKPGTDYIGVGVGGIIFNKEGKALLALRGDKTPNESNHWEFPGGELEFGEDLEEALIREIKEEFGIEIRIERLVDICNHLIPAEKQHWLAIAYTAALVSGEPVIREPATCKEVGWFAWEEIGNMKLSIATRHNYEALSKRPELRIIAE